MRDVGVFITWLQDDMVNDITSFRGRNAGGNCNVVNFLNKVQRMFI